MDRNSLWAWMGGLNYEVALRKESVDRNGMEIDGVSYDVWSLSARRAWIEMQVFQRIAKPFRVALRKESVDRNGVKKCFDGFEGWSLSARRAWIEIRTQKQTRLLCMCRSPQGERG